MRRHGALLLLSAWLASAGLAQVAPLPSWVRAFEVPRPEVPVYAAADENAPRRGTLLYGARVPFSRRVQGTGCGHCGVFVELAPEAFACERDLVPAAERAAMLGASRGAELPLEYLQVMRDGTEAYAATADYFSGEYATVLGKGFVVAVAGRVHQDGVGFVRAQSGLYLRDDELRPVHASRFAGAKLQPGELAGIGFVIEEAARVLAAPKGALVRRAKRLERVSIASEEPSGWLQLRDGTFMAARSVVRPELRAPPPEVEAGERFIDVDLQRQMLVAYEGTEPVFVTLISSGREQPGSRTPRGAFRIWVKLRESDMRDSQSYALEQSYAIEHVPWVQYFKQGFALHAAFWHDRFGEPHSHGCVNLSPDDARLLFDFTSPALPAGWFAVHPTPNERGTLVVLR